MWFTCSSSSLLVSFAWLGSGMIFAILIWPIWSISSFRLSRLSGYLAHLVYLVGLSRLFGRLVDSVYLVLWSVGMLVTFRLFSRPSFFIEPQKLIFVLSFIIISNGGKDFVCRTQSFLRCTLPAKLMRISAGETIGVSRRHIMQIELPGLISEACQCINFLTCLLNHFE